MEFVNKITKEEEMRLKRIDEDCKALHVLIPPKAFLEYTITGADGKPRKKYKSLSKSWVRNAYNHICQQLGGADPALYGSSGYGAGSIQLTPTSTGGGGSNNTYDFMATPWGEASSGDETLGIVAGTSDTAESLDDYALGATIADGTSAGQLSYGGQSLTAVWSGANSKWTMTHTRVLSNLSGGSITVKETGILAVTGIYDWLLNRDVLSSAETVANGEAITITYTIEITLP